MNHKEVTKMLEWHFHNTQELIFAIERAGGTPAMITREDIRVSELLEIFARNGIRMKLAVERPES